MGQTSTSWDSRQLLRLVGLFVAAVLVCLAFYPGTFASSDTVPEYAFSVEKESTEEYEYVAGRIDAQHDERPDRHQIDELSPVVRDLYDEADAAGPHGRHYTPVCTDHLLFCDGHSRGELLDREFEEFSLPEDVQTRDAFVYVEDDGERSLLVLRQPGGHTESRYHFHLYLVGLTMIPAGAFVAGGSLTSKRDRLLAGTVGGGVLVVILGIGAGAIERVGLVSVSALLLLVFVGVWTSIVAVLGYRLYRRWSDSTHDAGSRRPPPE